MQNSCIFTRPFEESRTMYSASERVENLMGRDTKVVIDKLFNTTLQRFQQAQETSNDNESVELLYHFFQETNIRRSESYIISPNWIVNKKSSNKPQK